MGTGTSRMKSSMTPGEKARFIAGLMSLAVYVAIAWPISGLLGESVWSVLGWLIAIRAFFGLVEGLAGILNWRLFARERAVAAYILLSARQQIPTANGPAR